MQDILDTLSYLGGLLFAVIFLFVLIFMIVVIVVTGRTDSAWRRFKQYERKLDESD